MFKQVDYAMVIVSDMARSVAFYRDQLGLQLRIESSDWTEFQTGETTLALHGGGEPVARHDSSSSGKQRAGTCSLGFTVENLEETYDELKAKGVRFVMPPTVSEQDKI